MASEVLGSSISEISPNHRPTGIPRYPDPGQAPGPGTPFFRSSKKAAPNAAPHCAPETLSVSGLLGLVIVVLNCGFLRVIQWPLPLDKLERLNPSYQQLGWRYLGPWMGAGGGFYFSRRSSRVFSCAESKAEMLKCGGRALVPRVGAEVAFRRSEP